MNQTTLYQAVVQLAKAMGELPDEALNRHWTWVDHSEDLRIALLGTYQELRALAVDLRTGRSAADHPPTVAQQALAQYHAAYRDLSAVLLAASDEDLDRPPAEGEWPLRAVLQHIIDADRMFFALVHQAVERSRGGLDPAPLSRPEMRRLVGTRKAFKETMASADLAGILAYYEEHHDRVMHEVAGWNERDLEAISPFWEKMPKPVRYRLHRFDAHLRQHTVQAQKTLAAIGRPANEAKTLLRLLFNALSEVEGATVGLGEVGQKRIQELAQRISARAEEAGG